MKTSLNRTALFVFVMLAAPFTTERVQGQVSFTVGGVKTEALGGQWGGDLRMWVDPALSPVGAYLGADYFLADCTEDCGLWGWRVGGVLRAGVPVFKPYLTGAYVVRKVELDGSRFEKKGLAVGIGVRLSAPLNVYAEASREFLGDSLKGWFLRIGLGI